MEFCIISPVAGLERYAKLSKTHLVLAHILDKKYIDFYQQCRADGDFIILDNGAYESAGTDGPSLVEAIRRYNPHIVTLPDYLLEPWRRTWHASIAFLDSYADRFPDVQWLYIPQAEEDNSIGWMMSYQEALDEERISWIGIPRAYSTHIMKDPLARVKFAEMHSRVKRVDKKLHAFGMVNGDVHELGYLANAGVKSIDSSAPVWRGWCGQSIIDRKCREWWDKFGEAVNFSEEARPLQEALIMSNLEACGVRIPNR